jgi:hypothetical protein
MRQTALSSLPLKLNDLVPADTVSSYASTGHPARRSECDDFDWRGYR